MELYFTTLNRAGWKDSLTKSTEKQDITCHCGTIYNSKRVKLNREDGNISNLKQLFRLVLHFLLQLCFFIVINNYVNHLNVNCSNQLS